ncbi:MAG: hypothetical protein ABII90_15235 [Bacteroidota bacterium]
MSKFKVMKLIVNILLLVVFSQVIYGQSEVDSVKKESNLPKTGKLIGLADPYYIGNFNYPVKPDEQISYSLSTRMVLSPEYYYNYAEKYHETSTDAVGLLIEIAVYSFKCTIEQRKLQNYQK